MLTALMVAASAAQAASPPALRTEPIPIPPAHDAGPAAVGTVSDAPPPPSIYMVRLGGGFGLPAPSAQRDALGEDGYNTGTRLWLTLDASLLASQRVGFGAWAAAWRAQDDPDDGGPTLHEKAFLGGFQMPLLFPTGRATAMLVPRLGIATGSVDFGTSDYKTSVAYGMEMGLLFRLGDGRRLLHPSLGACVGALWAPSSRPGELGRENNLGGFYFALVGGLDG